MTESGKRYAEISAEKRKETEEAIYEAVVEQFRQDKTEEGSFKYKVLLQNIKFITIMSCEELRVSAKLVIDVLEELKEINNSGVDRTVLEQMVAEAKTEEASHVRCTMEIWNRMVTDRLKELVAEIDSVRRVDGIWAVLFANPGLISAIYAVFDRLVDCFEDEELYITCGFFLLRAIMRINSDTE